MQRNGVLLFHGSNFLRQRVVMATLSGKAIRIEQIRSNHVDPGLRDFELCFLQLIEKLTNGSTIEISFTGTTLSYRPGLFVGGKVSHDCPTSRGLGYFLEPVLALAPFGKEMLQLTLTGVTNNNVDVSVDLVRNVWLPLLQRNFFPNSSQAGIEMKIVKRGAPPDGGGEIFLSCPSVKHLKPVTLIDCGSIKRIRGIAYATRVQPHFANRMVDGARGELNEFIPDIYIYTDVYKGAESGLSPGYAISLVAESTTGMLVSAEVIGHAGDLPEECGRTCAKRLMEEISYGGCIDTISQGLVLLWSVLTTKDVSKLSFGKLAPYSIQYLRDIRTFFGIVYRIVPNSKSHTVSLTCVGTGYVNLNKKVT